MVCIRIQAPNNTITAKKESSKFFATKDHKEHKEVEWSRPLHSDARGEIGESIPVSNPHPLCVLCDLSWRFTGSFFATKDHKEHKDAKKQAASLQRGRRANQFLFPSLFLFVFSAFFRGNSSVFPATRPTVWCLIASMMHANWTLALASTPCARSADSLVRAWICPKSSTQRTLVWR